MIYAQAAASITSDTLTAAAVDTSYLQSLLNTMDTMRTVVLALSVVTVVAVLALCVVHALRKSRRSNRGGKCQTWGWLAGSDSNRASRVHTGMIAFPPCSHPLQYTVLCMPTDPEPPTFMLLCAGVSPSLSRSLIAADGTTTALLWVVLTGAVVLVALTATWFLGSMAASGLLHMAMGCATTAARHKAATSRGVHTPCAVGMQGYWVDIDAA